MHYYKIGHQFAAIVPFSATKYVIMVYIFLLARILLICLNTESKIGRVQQTTDFKSSCEETTGRQELFMFRNTSF